MIRRFLYCLSGLLPCHPLDGRTWDEHLTSSAQEAA